jgi:hypothetical protein
MPEALILLGAVLLVTALFVGSHDRKAATYQVAFGTLFALIGAVSMIQH